MKNLDDLFEQQLKNLYSMEVQLEQALRELMEQACYGELLIALDMLLGETKGDAQKLEDLCRTLETRLEGRECKVMNTLIGEAAHLMGEALGKHLRDTVLIAQLQLMVGYVGTGYATAVEWAKEIGQTDIAEKLQLTLANKYDMEERLYDLAEERRIGKDL